MITYYICAIISIVKMNYYTFLQNVSDIGVSPMIKDGHSVKEYILCRELKVVGAIKCPYV